MTDDTTDEAMPKQSEWTCYMFGTKPHGSGLCWRPNEGEVPNVFVRFFMRVCLGCTWVRDRKANV